MSSTSLRVGKGCVFYIKSKTARHATSQWRASNLQDHAARASDPDGGWRGSSSCICRAIAPPLADWAVLELLCAPGCCRGGWGAFFQFDVSFSRRLLFYLHFHLQQSRSTFLRIFVAGRLQQQGSSWKLHLLNKLPCIAALLNLHTCHAGGRGHRALARTLTGPMPQHSRSCCCVPPQRASLRRRRTASTSVRF